MVNCASCANALGKPTEKQIVFCAVLRVQVGTWLSRECEHYRDRSAPPRPGPPAPSR